jgi:hypothetical protein
MDNTVQPSKYSLDKIPHTGQIDKLNPKSSITLIEPWVVWEYTACIFTDGVKFKTEDLHDAIKAHAENQNLPINVFYDSSAHWIIEGAWGRAKVDDDLRPRVTMNLRDTRYSDMQFITGIDYFGDCWANFQMMMVVQPESLDKPAKPIVPDPLIPTEALLVLVVVAIVLFLLNGSNNGIQVLSIVGLIGALIIWAISRQNVRDAQRKYEKWKEEIAKIELEEIEIRKNRLSRSFKSDDLFVFHEVVSTIIRSIIVNSLLNKGGRVEQSNENNHIEQVIPKSQKDILKDKLDDF